MQLAHLTQHPGASAGKHGPLCASGPHEFSRNPPGREPPRTPTTAIDSSDHSDSSLIDTSLASNNDTALSNDQSFSNEMFSGNDTGVSTDLFAHNDSALNADAALTNEPQTHVGF